MKINEIKEKAESLNEQGVEARQMRTQAQYMVGDARNQLLDAQLMYEEASKTDEDGNPMGDVVSAQGAVLAAQARLLAAQGRLREAENRINSIDQKKNDTISEIEKYTEKEEQNLLILEQLQGKRFGGIAGNFINDLVTKLNQGQDVKRELEESLGRGNTSKRFAVNGASQEADGFINDIRVKHTNNQESEIQGGLSISSYTKEEADHLLMKGFSREEAAPVHQIAAAFNDDADELSRHSSAEDENEAIFKSDTPYTSIDELSDDVYKYAAEFRDHGSRYNEPIRNNETNQDVEHFRKIINSHRITANTTVCRLATWDDLGPGFEGRRPEELIGQCYQFDGIMSVAKEYKFAGGKNDGRDVFFEIHVPEGTPGLDLREVPQFYQAMFDSPKCQIESVTRIENSNATKMVVSIIKDDERTRKVQSVRSNNYLFEYDKYGRVQSASGRLQLKKEERDASAQKSAGGANRREDDDGGHFFASIFNGPGTKTNIFPQNYNFNRGGYRSWEKEWKKEIENGNTVDLKIKPIYQSDSMRPISIQITAIITEPNHKQRVEYYSGTNEHKSITDVDTDDYK